MDLQKLTKKNQEFIHIATNQFIQDGLSDTEIKGVLEEIIPDILEKQQEGIPARSFLGAPTVWASTFTKQAANTDSEADKNTNPWLMWLDTSLLFLGVLALVTGAMNLFSKQAPSYGLVSLLFLSFGGGAVMYATHYYIYRHLGKEKSQRPNMFKAFGIMVVLMFIWLLLYSATSFLPQAFNPVVPALLLLIAGGIALAARFYFKKKYNIQSAMDSRPRNGNNQND